jgi:hypothetical protein
MQHTVSSVTGITTQGDSNSVLVHLVRPIWRQGVVEMSDNGFVDKFHVEWIVLKAVRELLLQSPIELPKHQLESMNKILVCKESS